MPSERVSFAEDEDKDASRLQELVNSGEVVAKVNPIALNKPKTQF